jgi:hypothetical protein
MKLNHRYTLTLNAQITYAGVGEIRRLLWTAKGDWSNTYQFLPPLPNNFDFVWMSDDGKLTTRVSHYYYKQFSIKLPASILTEIGNIARAHSHTGETYHFEFVNRITWDDGDFGDDGSCYWGSNGGAREMLEDNGALAIRFYDADGYGIARAWLYDATKFWVLWNGYGFADNSTLTIAKVFASFTDHTYKQIYLANHGVSSGTLYINNGKGYVIGTTEAIENLRTFDLGFNDIYADTCYECDRTVYEDEVYWGPDDNTYCQHCFYRLYDRCTMCGETYEQDEITYLDGSYLCEDCLESHRVKCEKCGNYYISHGYRSCLNCGVMTTAKK